MQSALTSEICHSSYLYHENDVFFNYIYGMFLIKIESKDNIISQAMKIKLFSKKDAKWFAFFMSCMFCQKSLRISKSQNWLIELTNSWWVFFDVCAHVLWNKGRREPVYCHVTIIQCFAFFFYVWRLDGQQFNNNLMVKLRSQSLAVRNVGLHFLFSAQYCWN